MYVNNGKISSRQTFRLYVFDLMGIATLLLPPYLASICGINGIFAILLGTGAGFLYLFYLGWIMKKMGTDLSSYLKTESWAWTEKLFLGLVMFHSIVTGGFCGYVFANLMQYSLVKDSAYEIILLLIVVVSAYAVSGGIESRARVYEVLFWFVLIPYVIMMLLSIKDFEVLYIENLFSFETGDLLRGAFLVFLFLTPLFFSLFLIGEKEKNYGRNIVKTVASAIFLSGIILLGSYFLLVANFGEQALSTMRFPVVTLMSTIQFKGNFLKRMDALMLAVWFFTLYALLNLHLHYGVKLLQELTGGKKEEERGSMWKVIFPALGVWIVAYGLHLNADYVYSFFAYYAYLAVPFVVIAPGVLLLLRRKKG